MRPNNSNLYTSGTWFSKRNDRLTAEPCCSNVWFQPSGCRRGVGSASKRGEQVSRRWAKPYKSHVVSSERGTRQVRNRKCYL